MQFGQVKCKIIECKFVKFCEIGKGRLFLLKTRPDWASLSSFVRLAKVGCFMKNKNCLGSFQILWNKTAQEFMERIWGIVLR